MLIVRRMDTLHGLRSVLNKALSQFRCEKCSNRLKGDIWMIDGCLHKYCSECYKALDKDGLIKICSICDESSQNELCVDGENDKNELEGPDQFTTQLLRKLIEAKVAVDNQILKIEAKQAQAKESASTRAQDPKKPNISTVEDMFLDSMPFLENLTQIENQVQNPIDQTIQTNDENEKSSVADSLTIAKTSISNKIIPKSKEETKIKTTITVTDFTRRQTRQIDPDIQVQRMETDNQPQQPESTGTVSVPALNTEMESVFKKPKEKKVRVTQRNLCEKYFGFLDSDSEPDTPKTSTEMPDRIGNSNGRQDRIDQVPETLTSSEPEKGTSPIGPTVVQSIAFKEKSVKSLKPDLVKSGPPKKFYSLRDKTSSMKNKSEAAEAEHENPKPKHVNLENKSNAGEHENPKLDNLEDKSKVALAEHENPKPGSSDKKKSEKTKYENLKDKSNPEAPEIQKAGDDNDKSATEHPDNLKSISLKDKTNTGKPVRSKSGNVIYKSKNLFEKSQAMIESMDVDCISKSQENDSIPFRTRNKRKRASSFNDSLSESEAVAVPDIPKSKRRSGVLKKLTSSDIVVKQEVLDDDSSLTPPPVLFQVKDPELFDDNQKLPRRLTRKSKVKGSIPDIPPLLTPYKDNTFEATPSGNKKQKMVRRLLDSSPASTSESDTVSDVYSFQISQPSETSDAKKLKTNNKPVPALVSEKRKERPILQKGRVKPLKPFLDALEINTPNIGLPKLNSGDHEELNTPKTPILTPRSLRTKYTPCSSTPGEKRNAKGETALHIAARSGQVEKLEQLISKGVDINARDFASWTPLHEAVNGKTMNTLKICKMLLEAGCNVNIPGMNNETALHEAARLGKSDVVSLLLSYCAAKNIRNAKGQLPRDVAKSVEIATLIEGYKGPYFLSLKVPSTDDSLYRVQLEKGKVFFAYKASKDLIHKFEREFNTTVLSQLSTDVTHIIFDIQPKERVPLSFDYLYGVVTGVWLLSSKWIHDSMEKNKVPDPELYEIPGCTEEDEEKLLSSREDGISTRPLNEIDETPKRARLRREFDLPGLFNGFSIYIYKNSSYKFLSKRDLGKVISGGGGNLIIREPNPETADPMEHPIRYHAQDPPNKLLVTSHLILYNSNSKNEPQIKHNMEHLKSLQVPWLIYSLLKFKLLDPTDFL